MRKPSAVISLSLWQIIMRFRSFRDFEDGELIDGLGFDIVIHRRSIGELVLPSGRLLACDPISSLDGDPFEAQLEPGTYQAHLIIAELRDEKSVAYAVIDLQPSSTVRRWELAELPSSTETSIFNGDDEMGFAVDSTLAAFLDAETQAELLNYHQIVMPEDNDYERHIWGRINKRRRTGAGWTTLDLRRDLAIPVADGRNMLLFDAGFGEGYFSTYLGYDQENQLVKIVTDFEVLDLRFPSFAFPT